jgi:REP element-mobilizing transposase RayT
MNRGARRQPIFKLPADCQGLLDLLGDTVDRFGLEIHAYALMPNHYHLIVRSVLGNLSEAMQYVNGSYTLWLNRRHHWDGPVFRGRFRSQLIEDEAHLRMLLAYVHLNPLRARLVPRLTSEAWTSYRAYLELDQTPDWLTTQLFIDLMGGKAGLKEFVQSVHRGATRYPGDFNPETGLFSKKALIKTNAVVQTKAALPRKDARHREAEEVMAEVCRITRASEEQLLLRELGPRANPARRFAVWALYRGAGMKQRDIAKRLRVPYYQVSKTLSRLRKGGASQPLRGWMREWLNAE